MPTRANLYPRRLLVAGMAAAAIAAVAGPAKADDVADFFRGKTVSITVGFAAGGGYDQLARLAANHIGRHIPGKPSIVVRNRPAGGGLVNANWLYEAAARDGTQLGVVNQAAGLNQNLGYKGVKYDAAAFNWIGRLQIGDSQLISWHTSGIKTVQDALHKEVRVSATGPLGTTAIVPRLINRTFGTKFQVLTGYNKITEAWLAMERGEVEATGTSIGALKTRRPDWLPQKKIFVLAQLGLERPKEIPDAPLIQELAKNEFDRKALELFSTAATVGRSLMAPPGVPPARVAALRKAFDDMVKDPAFVEEARKTNSDIDALGGEKLQALVEAMIKAPTDVVERAKVIAKP